MHAYKFKIVPCEKSNKKLQTVLETVHYRINAVVLISRPQRDLELKTTAFKKSN